MKKLLLLNLILLLIEFACRKDGPGSTNSRLYIPATKWTLTYIQDIITKDTLNFPIKAQQIYGPESITFSEYSDTIIVKYLCNNNGYAIYKIFAGNDSIHCSEVFRTQGSCAFDFSDWEDYLFLNLRDAYKYKITDSTLAVYSKLKYNLYFVYNKN